MKPIRLILILMILPLIWSCQTSTTAWTKLAPVEFINMLEQMAKEGDTTFFILHKDVQTDWIKKEQLPEIVKLLDDKTPCANVTLDISSYLAPVSTVQTEAAYIIQGFRSGEYPPALNSNRFKIDIDEIKEWWRQKIK